MLSACMIIMNCKRLNNGSKNNTAETNTTSFGEGIQFLQSDKIGECKAKSTGNVLKAKHNVIVTHSDRMLRRPD